MALSTEEKILIEHRLANEKKSTLVAYLLWLFLGYLGGHRFYCGKASSGIGQLAMFFLGVMLAAAGVGLLILGALGIWVLVDAFLIPNWIVADLTARRETMLKEASTSV